MKPEDFDVIGLTLEEACTKYPQFGWITPPRNPNRDPNEWHPSPSVYVKTFNQKITSIEEIDETPTKPRSEYGPRCSWHYK